MTLRIRKGDLVQVIRGSDRGKQGRVIAVDPERDRLRVEKVRVQKRHYKAGSRRARTGGIIEQEGYIAASSVLLVDPTTQKPDRVRVEVRDARRTRVFARSGEPVPDPVGS